MLVAGLIRQLIALFISVFVLAGAANSACNMYVAFGDSITEGKGDKNLANGKGYPPILSARLGSRVVNAGIPGNKSIDGVRRISAVLSNNPDATHVLIQFGTNDATANKSVDEYRNNMQEIVSAVINAGKKALIAQVPVVYRKMSATPCTPDDGDTQSANERIREYNVVIEQLVLDGSLNVLPGPDFYSYFDATQMDAQNKSTEFGDCLHPNDSGYQSMAELWDEAIPDRDACPPSPPTNLTVN